MRDPIPASQKTNRWIWVLLTVGIVLTAIFGFRAVRSFAQVRLTGLQPGTTDVGAIRGWMTIPYISKAFGVPADYLYQQINVPAPGSAAKSLGDLSREFFPGQPGVILQKVKAAIQSYQATSQPQGPSQ
jgi:hypothetical protein